MMRDLRADYPIDPVVVAICREMRRLAHLQGLSFCVVGATARDLLLSGVHGITTGSSTRDVDFALAVPGWNEFSLFRDALIGSGLFAEEQGAQHRFRFLGTGAAYPLDLIPFGGVVRSDDTLAWPPELAIVMNMAGYAEMFANAELIQIAEGLAVHVASLPGLATLKIFAWLDRNDQTTRDAGDLRMLLSNYGEAGNLDRLFDAESELMEWAEFDIGRAATALLGRDVRRTVSSATLVALLCVLEDPGVVERFIVDMSRGSAAAAATLSAEVLLESFLAGLRWA